VGGLTLLSLLAMQVPLLTAAAGAARRRGFSRSQIAGAFFRQPRGWPCFWYPRRFRRKDDVWDRLPPPFRHWRVLATVFAADLVFLAWMFSAMNAADFLDRAAEQRLQPLAPLLVGLGQTFAIVFVASLLAAPVVLLRCARFLRSQGLPTYELRRISRAFLSGPTADRALWKKAELARFLLPPRAAAAGLKPPASPREYPEALARMADGCVGEARQSADRAVAAAKGLVAALADDDALVARLGRGFDPGEAGRVEARLDALGQDGPDDEDRRELRGLLSRQRDLLRRQAARIEQTRAHRERGLRLLEELWRRVQAAARPGHAAALAAAVADADAFAGSASATADLSSVQTAVRPETPSASG
jgi:hypothetical protein